jgi:RNA polymerase sigma factor (sigma-70 family)
MGPEEMEAALATAADQICRKARRLARRRDFCLDDEDDIVQTLTARLLVRLSEFDPTVMSLEAFMRRVVKQGASNLVRDRHAQRRHDPAGVSLATPVPDGDGSTVELAATLPEAQLRTHRGSHGAGASAELTADLATWLAGLPADQRALADAYLREGTVTATARVCGVSRTRVYAALRRWRTRARQLALDGYLEKSADT